MLQPGANRRLARLTLLAVAGGARISLGQMLQVDSNQPPTTDKLPGFSVRKEQREIDDAFEDFDRYRDKSAWEKAFTAIAKVEDAKPRRLIADKDGFFVPTESRIRTELLSLPPQGREAYRLFNDAKARQLLTDLTSVDGSPVPNEIDRLSKIVNRYFITTVGDQAADRLGDALFESGDFLNAQRCWAMILDNFPDSSLPAVLLQTKRAVALARAGEWDKFETVRSVLHERYAGMTAHIAGQDVVACDYVDALKTADVPGTNPSGAEQFATATSTFVRRAATDSPLLPDDEKPVWQIPLMDAQAVAQLNTQLGQNGWQQMAGQFSSAVPATAVDEQRIYINWLGICFACDLKTGKLLWRTDTLGDMPTKMAQTLQQGTVIDPKTYSITIVGDNVIVSRRSNDNQDYNQIPMTRLVCLTRDKGKPVWKSEQGPLSSWGFVGSPLIGRDVFYSVVHAAESQDLSLLCIGLAHGEIRWKADLGTPATSMNWRGQPSVPPPVLLQQSGKILILTNNGAFLQVDEASHSLDWAMSYPSYIEPQQQYYYGSVQTEQVIAPGTILSDGATLYFKESKNNQLYAVDPSGPSIKWKRRIDSEAGLAGVDSHHLFMAGPEIECLDVDSHVLQWDATTFMGTPSAQPLIQGDWVYLFGRRGIESVRLSSGEAGRRFRGYDRDCDGGTLWKTSTRLVTVSSHAVTAYPLAAK